MNWELKKAKWIARVGKYRVKIIFTEGQYVCSVKQGKRFVGKTMYTPSEGVAKRQVTEMIQEDTKLLLNT